MLESQEQRETFHIWCELKIDLHRLERESVQCPGRLQSGDCGKKKNRFHDNNKKVWVRNFKPPISLSLSFYFVILTSAQLISFIRLLIWSKFHECVLELSLTICTTNFVETKLTLIEICKLINDDQKLNIHVLILYYSGNCFNLFMTYLHHIIQYYTKTYFSSSTSGVSCAPEVGFFSLKPYSIFPSGLKHGGADKFKLKKITFYLIFLSDGILQICSLFF